MDGNNSKAITRNGFFSIGSHHDLPGRLSLQGSNSILHIWTSHSLHLNFLNYQDITGTLDNQEKVSLIKCIKIRERIIGHSTGISTHYEFFSHYVTVGHDYLSNSDRIIERISFTVDDAHALFSYGKFSETLRPNSNQIEELTRLGIFNRLSSIEEDNNSMIVYSTIKPTIFSIDTAIGKISAHNCVITNQSIEKLSIEKKILVSIKFTDFLNIEEMYEKIDRVLRFLEIISGRPQNLLEVKVTVKDQDESEKLSLHLNTYPIRTKRTENPSPNSCDVLINADNKPEQFASLMSHWLKQDEDNTWLIARRRFSDAWDKQRSYDPDRIVAAANMFDLLPRSIFPEGIELPRNLTDAIQTSKKLFKKLPHSSKRDSFLAYLGQINKSSLKEKIRYRSQLIKNIIQDDLREIDRVTDEAVELRNFYVHGDKPNGRREKLTKFTPFLTDTLEFVFCVSNLIDLNWNFLSWYEITGRAGHPFSVYMHNYPDQSTEFLNYLEGISG